MSLSKLFRALTNIVLCAAALALVVFIYIADRNRPAMQATSACVNAAVAYYRGDYRSVLQYLKPYADNGDPDAQRRIADIYADGGGGVPQDTALAMTIYLKAARKGDTRAAANLAALLDLPPGLPQDGWVVKDPVAAVKWLRVAANEGDALSQMDLADDYISGEGVAKDPAEAAIWFRRAADQGLAPAQVRLAELYDEGLCVQQNFQQAARLYQMAADKGDPDGQGALAHLYFSGDGVPKDHVQAFKLEQQAANQGDAMAQYFSGMAYLFADGVARDIVRAEMWLTLAADSYYPKSDLYYKQIVRYRDSTAVNMNLSDLALARGLAADFKPKSTEDFPEEDSWCGVPPKRSLGNRPQTQTAP